jgi:two-component system sensor histidine kinase SenX3
MWLGTASHGLPAPAVYGIGAAILVAVSILTLLIGRHSGRRALSQRLTALGSRLGLDTPDENASLETALSYLEQVTGAATEAVAEASADAIRLRRSLDTFPQGVVLCDENGAVVYRNTRADALMTSRHDDALAAQVVTELLEDAWDTGAAERTLDLYGPPRRTLTVRAQLIDDGRRPLGVIAVIEDVSERRRLEEVRRDFVANVSHELKTPMGALGLLAETLVAEPDENVARRLASRIHTEAFRVSRIIDDLLDLSRIESEAAPPREPVPVNLVMAEAVERVRATAEQRAITIILEELEPQVVVLGDRRQLVSAMHALVENAVNYSYDASTVTVSAHVAPSTLETPGSWSAGMVRSAAQTANGGSAARAPDAPDVPRASRVPEAAESARVTALRGPNEGPIGVHEAASAAAEPLPQLPVQATNGGGGATEEAQMPPSRDTVRISVIDHGVGIPARDLERIFERFYRVDQGRSRDTGGTGLGLSIVRHVASNHRGWVEVQSREGEGSTFTLVLPLPTDRHG